MQCFHHVPVSKALYLQVFENAVLLLEILLYELKSLLSLLESSLDPLVGFGLNLGTYKLKLAVALGWIDDLIFRIDGLLLSLLQLLGLGVDLFVLLTDGVFEGLRLGLEAFVHVVD